MPDSEWLKLLSAALGGGLTVKALDIGYQEVRRRLDFAHSARQFVDTHLDPILKSADELVGKLRSLADNDFKSIWSVKANEAFTRNNDFASLLFLFAKFWATIEISRKEGLSISIAKDPRGRELLNFLDCIESRKVRIVDRISQRAIGELMLTQQNSKSDTIQFIEFIERAENDAMSARWVAPLVHTLTRSKHTAERQRILQYGAVIHAMIDRLDPKHLATKSRPSYPNKLSRSTLRDLKYRVFRVYLKSVTDPAKYLGPPKGGPK